MTVRKRRNPTHGFKLPSIFNPITGQHSPLQIDGDFPYCALMQVAAEDTHDNYVTCRGYDTRNKKFYPYVEGDADKIGISVAKPYPKRTPGMYQVGDVLPAFIPLTRIGHNPGQSTGDDGGQPDDLEDDVELMKDDNDMYVNWLIVDGGAAMARVEVLGELTFGLPTDSASALIIADWDGVGYDEVEMTVWNTPHGAFSKMATVLGDGGADGWAIYVPDRNRWELVWMDIPGMIYGTLKGDLSHGSFGAFYIDVVNVISGYNVWGTNWDTANPAGQAVYNPSASGPAISYWFAGDTGDTVICQWSAEQALFGIIAVEPNQKDWAGQLVDVGGVPNAKTIYSPPWAPAV